MSKQLKVGDKARVLFPTPGLEKGDVVVIIGSLFTNLRSLVDFKYKVLKDEDTYYTEKNQLEPIQDDPLVVGGHVINEYPPPFGEDMVENCIQYVVGDFSPNVTEKQPMKFETRIFINGVDASTMTDAQIFEEIHRSLEEIKRKPGKLKEEIDCITDYIINLTTYVAGRD